MTRNKAVMVLISALVVTAAVVALLVTIVERRQEAKLHYFKVADVAELEPDPSVWGKNFPGHYEALLKTMKTSELARYSLYGRYGGSESFSKLEEHPAYKRLFAGYGFAVDYNEDRGHARALEDMLSSKRVNDKTPGTCLTCKSSHVPSLIGEMTPGGFYSTPLKELIAQHSPKHSISCADCHDSNTMALRISRPALREALEARGFDLDNAGHQEMRTYVCAQCHVEYYFKGEGKYLTFPWTEGLLVDNIEAYYDGMDFKDWQHEETGSPLVKIQHPEYELWSTGIHARSGVSCVDCHMPFKREGATKITDHWVRTPLVNLVNSCATCHRLSEDELRERIIDIQDRTFGLLKRAEMAILDAQDAMIEAMRTGVSTPALNKAQRLHRRAFIRWDFISAENSMGFHSPQEATRILGDAVDYARQAELAAYRAMRETSR